MTLRLVKLHIQSTYRVLPRGTKEVRCLPVVFNLYTFDSLDRAPTLCSNSFKHALSLRVGDGNNKYDFSNVLAHQR